MKKIKKILILVALVAIFLNMLLIKLNFAAEKGQEYYDAINARQMVFLSDLDFDERKSSVGYDRVRKDQNLNGKKISLLVEGERRNFLKGIFAHGQSVVEYDLSRLRFDFLEGYLGIDMEAGNTDGVRFLIEGDKGEGNFEKLYESDGVLNKYKSERIKVGIAGVKKLRLIVNRLNNNYSDWSVYAGAKLTKTDYRGKSLSELKTLSEYTKELEAVDTVEGVLADHEMTLLKRELVRQVGYEALQEMMEIDEKYERAMKWLLAEKVNLREFLTGGEPDGDYVKTMEILGQILVKHERDMNDESMTELGVKKKDMYRRIAISTSLTHSGGVCFWLWGNQCSNALDRYELFKEAHQRGLLANQVFENLVVEEMRWVMGNHIDNEQMAWLNTYARRFPKNDKPYNLDPYHYIRYTFDYNYDKPKYYDPAKKAEWEAKYGFSSFGVRYESGKPKIWMVLEEGAVCGGISKTGANLNGAFGIPSTVVGQPGHAAYLIYSKRGAEDANGNRRGVWGIGNDIYGWPESEKSERLLAGWGSGRQRKTDYPSYNVSYVLMSQANLNYFEKYQKAREMEMLAKMYLMDPEKMEEIYEKIVALQPIDFGGWQGLTDAYRRNLEKTEQDYLNLANRIKEAMQEFPLPMADLLKLIEKKLPVNKYLEIRQAGLEFAAAVNGETETMLQPGQTRSIAKNMLGRTEKIVNFSFSGADAGKIVLAERFNDSEVAFEYSLDGKRTWKMVRGRKHQLSEEEIDSISAENDVAVYFVGESGGCDENCNNGGDVGEDGKKRSPVHVVDIERNNRPNLRVNDLENSIAGLNVAEMEWRMGGEWKSFEAEMPNLDGDKIIEVRMRRLKNKLNSEAVELEFTAEEVDSKRSYVRLERLRVESVSSEERDRDPKERAIDGDISTMWHTRWHGIDNQRYIIVKSDKILKLSAIEYWPRQDGEGNGKIYKAKISTSEDGLNYVERLVVDWDRSSTMKAVEFVEPIKAQYLKLEGLVTERNFMSVALLNWFEDLSEEVDASGKANETQGKNGSSEQNGTGNQQEENTGIGNERSVGGSQNKTERNEQVTIPNIETPKASKEEKEIGRGGLEQEMQKEMPRGVVESKKSEESGQTRVVIGLEKSSEGERRVLRIENNQKKAQQATVLENKEAKDKMKMSWWKEYGAMVGVGVGGLIVSLGWFIILAKRRG